ncbi:MAG TPA: MerR family DNA-binding transcriptional regulator [Azospirillaceae bacterium]|nr:MerR family DNA-binding transcriptional regulator [Azospirillaceae bacterium]HRQ80737.1 MerR family DNA-binding transcriptional regulator [Azospirillaceae bacterium]
MEELYTVNQLAEELGITPRTLRFYEQEGLLSPGRVGNNRVYSKRDRARMKLILRGKRLGFSLSEIGEYLNLYDADPQKDSQIRHLLEQVRKRLAQLEQQRADIEATVDELRDIEEQSLTELKNRGASIQGD